MLQEAICRASAQGPAPVQDLVALIDESYILWIVSDELVDIHGLQLRHGDEAFNVGEFVLNSKLALNIETAGVDRAEVHRHYFLYIT